MSFFTSFTKLVIVSVMAMSYFDLAAAEGQLRGTTAAATTTTSQRILSGSSWCPQFFPGSDTSCSLTGMYTGTCFYSSSAQAGERPNTDSQACSCNKDGTSKFVCESKPFPGGIPTQAPVVLPQPTPSTTKWCPSTVPKTGDECALPNGMTTGSCSFMQYAQGKTTRNVCSCTSDSKTFTCVETVS